MKKIVLPVIIMLFACYMNAQDEKIVPSFEQVLSLQSAGAPVISSDVSQVLFTLTRTDWVRTSMKTSRE
ncbi:MAG TPA: hypothetical protein ENH59_10395 [Bacteroidetes bacterium]|nr:hypothetical protein [Bacteroidota bacterium]